jgi:hypothetical protein
MVETTFDVLRVPSITLSEAEIEEIKEQILAGQLPVDYPDLHYDAVEKNVSAGITRRTRTDGRSSMAWAVKTTKQEIRSKPSASFENTPRG